MMDFDLIADTVTRRDDLDLAKSAFTVLRGRTWMDDFNIGFDRRYAERWNSGATGFAWIRPAAAGLVELVHLADCHLH